MFKPLTYMLSMSNQTLPVRRCLMIGSSFRHKVIVFLFQSWWLAFKIALFTLLLCCSFHQLLRVGIPGQRLTGNETLAAFADCETFS